MNALKRIIITVLITVLVLVPITSFGVEGEDGSTLVQAQGSDVQAASDETCNHEYYEWDSCEPTCTTAGYVVYYCPKCEAQKRETVPATGHNWGYWYVSEYAGCTHSGVEERDCYNCGASEERAIPAHGHSWSDIDFIENEDYTNVLMYGQYCINDDCEETRYVTYKTIKKGKSKKLFNKKQLRKFKKKFKKIRFSSEKKKIVTINKKTGKMKAKKKGKAIVNMEVKYQGEWFYIEFLVVVK